MYTIIYIYKDHSKSSKTQTEHFSCGNTLQLLIKVKKKLEKLIRIFLIL